MSPRSLFVQFGVALAASCAFLSFGAVRSWSSPAIPSLLNGSVINQTDVPAISSLSPLGAIPGAFIAGPCMNKFGRKMTLIGVSIPWIAAFITLSFAQTVEVFYVVRFVLGIMMGLAAPVAQIYISECVDANLRSSLGSLTSLLHATGILICYIAGKYLSWDNLSQLLAICPAFLFVGMCLSPQSPVWLAMKSRVQKASKSLAFLSGKSESNEDIMTALENLIVSTRKVQPSGPENPLQKMSRLSYLKPLLIAVTVMIFQQFGGINSIIFHTVLIFQLTEANIDSNLSTIIVGSTLLTFTIVATIVVNKFGRRTLLLISGSFMSLATGFLSFFFYVKENNLTNLQDFGWVPISCLIIFVAAFSIGYNNVPFLLMGELFPKAVKNVFSSITMMVHLTCSFLVVFSFPILANLIGGSGVFLLYSVVSFVGLPIIYFLVPETKGKTLEEIELMFLKSIASENCES